jgi:hypothetical protein
VDIEERADKWAREYAQENGLTTIGGGGIEGVLAAAYLAGSAQTQADYSGYCHCLCANCSGCLGA